MKSNSKYVQYGLMAVVVLIWGSIIFKVKTYNGNESSFPTLAPYIDYNINSNKALKDSFQLLSNYSDPFLGTKFKSTPKISNNSITKQTFPVKTQVSKPKTSPFEKKNKNAVRFPKIIYKGFAENGKSEKSVLMTIDGKRHSLNLYERLNGIRLSKIYKDSIEVEFKGFNEIYERQ